MSQARELKCPDCDSTEIEHDQARGHAVCVNCGNVLQNVMIAADVVSFQDDARGRSQAQGQFVNADGRLNRFDNPLAGHSRGRFCRR